MGIWPWEWAGGIESALKELIGTLAAVMIAFFIFLFGLLAILGKIAMPFGMVGRWVAFVLSFLIAAAIVYYVAIV